MTQAPLFAPSGLVTLLTDFGLDDPFVGVMKGAILCRFAGARIVDLTHSIAPQAVDQGAFWLERTYRYFPVGSVHVVVIDPGVGSERRGRVVVADEHCFVAPDNGLLARVLDAHPNAVVHDIDVAGLGLPTPSHTFHGRDVFAPVAAQIAAGVLDPTQVGPLVAGVPRIRQPRAAPHADHVQGTIVAVDRFGNLISDISSAELPSTFPVNIHLDAHVLPLARTYSEVPPGALVGVINGFDRLEVALRDGNAARSLGVGTGAAVSVHGAPMAQRRGETSRP